MAATHARPRVSDLGPGLAMTAVVVLVVAAAWIATWRTSDHLDGLLMAEVAGRQPADAVAFVVLSGVMMVAMMLPSALPMMAAVRGLAAREADEGEARLRTALFALGYVLVWTFFAAASLSALGAFGVLGGMTGRPALVPSIVLLAAGAYQLTGWKAFCLRHCRSPTAFLLGHWRSGQNGALRMGLHHALHCLGCCWLLMLVLFTAGAMSLLWMGAFAVLVAVEKLAPQGDRLSRAIGVAAIAVGAAAGTAVVVA